MKRKISGRIENLLRIIVVILALVVVLLPVVWIFSTSIKPMDEWMTSPPILLPSRIELSNYLQAWNRGGSRALFNSIILTSLSAVVATAFSSLAAFGISKHLRKSGNNVLFYFLSLKFLPPISIVLPIMIFYANLKLIDSYFGMTMVYVLINLALSVWIMKSFFDEIPDEIFEAALIDGCSAWTSLMRIAFPLAKSGIVVTALFCIVTSWNEYIFAVFLTRVQVYTLPVALYSWNDPHLGNLWGPQAALAVLSMVPILVITLFLQRHIVRGLTLGAVKG